MSDKPTKPPEWEYSSYRALLSHRGEPFALVSLAEVKQPSLPPAMQNVLMNALMPRLLHVTYGTDQGLVNLDTGVLLASVDSGLLFAPANIPRVMIHDDEVEDLYGEEHNWSDVIGYLQANYNWEGKFLP